MVVPFNKPEHFRDTPQRQSIFFNFLKNSDTCLTQMRNQDFLKYVQVSFQCIFEAFFSFERFNILI